MICTVRGREGDITIHNVQSVGQYDMYSEGGGRGILPSIMYSL